MRRVIGSVLIIIFVAAAAFAHAGHVHNFLGKVKSVAGGQLVITTPEKKDVTVLLTSTTAYTRDGKTAQRTDLIPGLRVSVRVADDGKTATEIKLGTK